MPELDLARRIVFALDGMADITSTRYVYRRAPQADLLMDVYSPLSAVHQGTPPALCFIHGGPIPETMVPPVEWGVFQSYGQLAAASGLVGIVFNHRLFAPTAYETAEGDVKAAVDYVRGNSHAIGVDPDRVGIWAFSGGGPLLSWCLRERPSFLKCLVAFYAMLDIRHLLPSGADAEQVERMRRLSAAAHLVRGSAPCPMLIARAGLDTPMVNTGIDLYVREAIASNDYLDVLNHPQGHHGFDVLDDDTRSRDIIARAIAFAGKRLTNL